ncbi:putative integral membrane [Diaporthe ampelina]|uniref:Putative integral membrane n=1 Tax=Diaporthe ampelina TaxID=1214573 RepID=A0A0G2I2K7_9PEZI|nr:putative integral membrane [Diaporthe ampelina]
MTADPSMVWLENTLKLLYASQMVYATVIMTAKLSILSLYWRLFPTVFMKRGCVILAVFTVMWWIAGVLVDIFQCSPVSKAFDPAMTPGGCISQNAWCMGMIIPNIFMDMIMLCLPTFEVSKLHLPRSQRFALAGVFLLGAAVTSASGIRLHYHLKLVESGEGNFDFTMGLFKPQLWLTIEPDMAIICACLPVLRPLITMVLSSPLYRSIASHLTVSGKITGSGGSSLGAGHGKHVALNTIGGSALSSGTGAGHHVREKSRGSGTTKYTMSSFESLEYLGYEDAEAGRLVPDGRVWSWLRLVSLPILVYGERYAPRPIVILKDITSVVSVVFVAVNFKRIQVLAT